MTLREKQVAFAQLLPRLIDQAFDLGYEVTLGECWRSKEEAERLAKAGLGIKNSLHTVRLAVDLNLFRKGVYLTKFEDYRPLGEWWERQTTGEIVTAWGGRFTRVDSGHFSIAHQGRK